MATTKFDINDAISAYDRKLDGIVYTKLDPSEEEKNQIIVDSDRSLNFVRDDAKREQLIEVLKRVLLCIPIRYAQGMSEIVSVVVYYFCGTEELNWKSADISAIENVSSILGNKTGESSKITTNDDNNDDDNNEDDEKDENGNNDDEDTTSNTAKKLRKKKRNLRKRGVKTQKSSDNGNSSPNSGEDGIQSSVQNESSIDFENPEIFEKMVVISTNILKMKIVPLIENDFEIYKKNNKIFRKMMSSRDVMVERDMSYVYMNHTLTWFTRLCSNDSDMFTLFSIFISCPTSFPFLVLTLFYDDVKNDRNVTLGDDLLEKLIELEKEFLNLQLDEANNNSGMDLMGILLIGGVLAVGLAIVVAGYRKKKDE